MSDKTNPVTDPRYVYEDDLNVLAYRMGMVETAVSGLDNKLDKIINEYPTLNTLKLTLEPIREDIRELKEKREAEAAEKIKAQQQVKYLALAALIGPLGTFVVTLFMVNLLGVQPA